MKNARDILRNSISHDIEFNKIDEIINNFEEEVLTGLYNVYKIIPLYNFYSGYSLVAAKTVEEANKYVNSFKESDVDNLANSFGYSCVEAEDRIIGLLSSVPGIIEYGIFEFGID